MLAEAASYRCHVSGRQCYAKIDTLGLGSVAGGAMLADDAMISCLRARRAPRGLLGTLTTALSSRSRSGSFISPTAPVPGGLAHWLLLIYIYSARLISRYYY